MDIPADCRHDSGARRATASMTTMFRALPSLCCCLAMVLAGCGSSPPVPDPDAKPEPAADRGESGIDPAPVSLPSTPVLPALAPDQYEWHGSWKGEPFWARFSPHAEDYGGRVLQVLYTPPESAALGGTVLSPHPWLLLGDDLTLIAWLERGRLSRAEYRSDDQPPGYRVNREVERRVGDDIFTDERSHRFPGPRGWDRRMAPLLLSLLWQADSSGSVAAYDVFAVDAAPATLSWDGAEVVLDGSTWQVEADNEGRLQRLLDADGTVILDVDEHLPLVPAEEAIERERRFLEDLEVE